MTKTSREMRVPAPMIIPSFIPSRESVEGAAPVVPFAETMGTMTVGRVVAALEDDDATGSTVVVLSTGGDAREAARWNLHPHRQRWSSLCSGIALTQRRCW
jgi:hypothetical protein